MVAGGTMSGIHYLPIAASLFKLHFLDVEKLLIKYMNLSRGRFEADLVK